MAASMYCMSVVESSARMAGALIASTIQAISPRVGVWPARNESMSSAEAATFLPPVDKGTV
jgi:hypothetical protein